MHSVGIILHNGIYAADKMPNEGIVTRFVLCTRRAHGKGTTACWAPSQDSKECTSVWLVYRVGHVVRQREGRSAHSFPRLCFITAQKQAVSNLEGHELCFHEPARGITLGMRSSERKRSLLPINEYLFKHELPHTPRNETKQKFKHKSIHEITIPSTQGNHQQRQNKANEISTCTGAASLS